MFTLVDLSIGLLRQVEGPVGNVEERENGGENDAGQDVDLFGAGGELVEPGLEKVFAFARLHVDLALVDVAHQRVVVAHVHRVVVGVVVVLRRAVVETAGVVAVATGTTPHQRLLKKRWNNNQMCSKHTFFSEKTTLTVVFVKDTFFVKQRT